MLGKETTWFPADLDKLRRAEAMYHSLSGWEEERVGDIASECEGAYRVYGFLDGEPIREHMIIR